MEPGLEARSAFCAVFLPLMAGTETLGTEAQEESEKSRYSLRKGSSQLGSSQRKPGRVKAHPPGQKQV